MNQPVIYLQGPDGEETELTVTSPDPDDGTFIGHLRDVDLGQVTTDWWVRLVLPE